MLEQVVQAIGKRHIYGSVSDPNVYEDVSSAEE